MDDLISRQTAIDALHMHLMYRMGTDSNKKRLDEWINNLPSTQPEIIRCKDCKYCDRGIDEDGNLFLKCLGWVYGGTQEEDFCSHAERRTNGRPD